MKKNIKLFVTTGNGIDEDSFVEVLENNFPEIPVLIEDSIGNYRLTNTSGMFLNGKTFIMSNFHNKAVANSFYLYDVIWVSEYEIALKCRYIDLITMTTVGGNGFGHSELEITVIT